MSLKHYLLISLGLRSLAQVGCILGSFFAIKFSICVKKEKEKWKKAFTCCCCCCCELNLYCTWKKTDSSGYVCNSNTLNIVFSIIWYLIVAIFSSSQFDTSYDKFANIVIPTYIKFMNPNANYWTKFGMLCILTWPVMIFSIYDWNLDE